MAKKVVTAYLNDNIFIPRIGDLKKTLPPESKTLTNFCMTLQDNGTLLLEFEYANQNHEFTVGASNIKGLSHPSTNKPSKFTVTPKEEAKAAS